MSIEASLQFDFVFMFVYIFVISNKARKLIQSFQEIMTMMNSEMYKNEKK
jgi:hypothetical protein